jgi:hypothetical protein
MVPGQQINGPFFASNSRLASAIFRYFDDAAQHSIETIFIVQLSYFKHL